jgi:hypothetical protein
MINESHDEAIKNIASTNGIESCCLLCGLNHQARDFIRAILLHLIDQLEENGSFIKFLHSNQYLTQEAYQNIAKKLEVKNNELAAQQKKSCNHFANCLYYILSVSLIVTNYFLSENLNLFFKIAYWPEMYTLYSSFTKSIYLLNTLFNRSKEK